MHCQKGQSKLPTMRVGISFELTPGVRSELLVGTILMSLFSELTAASLTAERITVTIDDYRGADTSS
jgi:hypothetical protein